MFSFRNYCSIMFIAASLFLTGCYEPLKSQKTIIPTNAYLYNKIDDALVLVKGNSNEHYGFGYEICGNGTLISENGYILTVSHTIINKNPYVELKNKTKHKARIIYNNKKFDIAILKIDVPEKLPYLEIAKSSFLGQRIHLFGKLKRDQAPQLYTGIIQAKGLNLSSKEITWIKQTIKGSIKGYNAVQNGIIHSARFKSGFSGGPIVDISGRLIAVNIGHFGKSAECISLSQEISTYQPIIDKVLSKGENANLTNMEFDIDLENSVKRMEWIMDGLVNHCIYDGNDPVCVNTLRRAVELQAKEKLSKPLASDTKTIKWAWKTFLDKIECQDSK